MAKVRLNFRCFFVAMLKILMVASEAAPFAKTGGLADVIGSLPAALAAQGVDVRVVMPRYSSVDLSQRAVVSLGLVRVPFDDGERLAEIQQAVEPLNTSVGDVPIYFVEAPHFFRRPLLYGYDDDILRFGFFSRAVLEMLRQTVSLKWRPDIIHCHDWHAALLPVYLRTVLQNDESLKTIKTVFSIHNLAYQGLAPKENLPRLGLDWSLFNHHQLEFHGQVNPLKAGLVFADALTTVSPRYAREIQTPEYGEGLDSVLRARDAALTGIINGIDPSAWHPLTDSYINHNYGALDWNNKARCKTDLLQKIGLQQEKNVPVIGMVSRLSSQKGFDLVADIMEPMLEMGCQFVLLGNGDERYLHCFNELGRRFPAASSMNLGKFNEELAHHIYAGSDLFLMPSLYEPCGLSQMIALAYGTVPIVRATGGLADSVSEWNPQTQAGNGFVFEEFSSAQLLSAVTRALKIYRSRAWPNLVKNAFAGDFSWDASAAHYKELYENLARDKRISDAKIPVAAPAA